MSKAIVIDVNTFEPYGAIEVKIGDATYQVVPLTSNTLAEMVAPGKEPDEQLALILGTEKAKFADMDVRQIGRIIKAVQAEIQREIEGKSGNPIAEGETKSQ